MKTINTLNKKIYVYIDYHIPEEYREDYFKLTIKEFDEAIKEELSEIYTTQIEAINSVYYKMGYDIILITSNKVIKMSDLVKNKTVRMTQNWQKMFRANCFDIKGDYSD